MDINIFSINQTYKKNQPQQILKNNKKYFPILDVFKQEIDEYNLSSEIYNVDVGEIPKNVSSKIAIIVDNSFYVQYGYLNNLISLNNLFRDGGLFCGPTDTHISTNVSNGIDKINQHYQKYKLDFGSSVVSDITHEIHNYPNMLCCAITGLSFNEFLYKPMVSPRHIEVNNSLFISEISNKYKIYYSVNLEKIKYLDMSDFSIESISQFYYQTGYQDGILISSKNTEEKRQELWHRFVESPEMLDNEMPRWLLDHNPQSYGEHLENLVICKCKYQIGFYEGMMSRKLI